MFQRDNSWEIFGECVKELVFNYTFLLKDTSLFTKETQIDILNFNFRWALYFCYDLYLEQLLTLL